MSSSGPLVIRWKRRRTEGTLTLLILGKDLFMHVLYTPRYFYKLLSYSLELFYLMDILCLLCLFLLVPKGLVLLHFASDFVTWLERTYQVVFMMLLLVPSGINFLK